MASLVTVARTTLEQQNSAKQGHPQKEALPRSVAGKIFHGLNQAATIATRLAIDYAEVSHLFPAPAPCEQFPTQDQAGAAPKEKPLSTPFCT